MLKALISRISWAIRDLLNEQLQLHQEYGRIKSEVDAAMPDNPALFGHKIYSQFDEDGIISYVFSKIGEGKRIFVEIGCSNGLENNTHALLLKGWRGVWVDADTDKISFVTRNLPTNNHLAIRCAFVSSGNALALIESALHSLGEKDADFLSIDIDGNDLGVLRSLMKKFKPRLLCVEYNAKFPPPLDISIDPAHAKGWSGDDYQGASLAAFVNTLSPLGYKLITCNLTGANAFFVSEADASLFPSYSTSQLYRPAHYQLRRLASGHPASLKFLADSLRARGVN